MRYENIRKAKFIERPNRFVAEIEIDDRLEKCHVKNTGRCKELLIKGGDIFVQDHTDNMGKRKLKYSLTAVYKHGIIVNVDSQVPNQLVEEALENKSIILPEMDELEYVKREQKFSNSRFDFFVRDINGKEGYIEVKGVTLEEGGIAYFPDAPTLRGVKHVKELCTAADEGYESYIIFVIQLDGVTEFRPNRITHPEFGDALVEAQAKGVHILAYTCSVTGDAIAVKQPLKINLK